jgi:putative DNA primase/helicase
VYIAFDSDSATNSNVNHAMRKLGSMLKRRGASSVRCVLIPTPNGSKVGLDDWFVSGGTVQDLVNASKEELPAIRRSRTQPSPKEYRLTEYGNAERLVDSNREDIRYCASLDRWLIWNGRHWEIDNDRAAAVYRRAAQVILDMIIEAGKTQDEDARKAILAHARRSDNYRVHQNMIYLASKMEGIPISAEDLDQGSGLLNLADCALDLTTFEMRPHRREDYLTRLIDIPYNPHGGCKRWVEFLETILQGKTELLRYVHKAAGYSLTGENSEKCFFFLYGNRGDNGKSVFIDTLMSIMGPYASSTPTSTLIAKKNEGSIPNDLARLKGIRFVAASETGENKRLDEELIKSLTGKDRISARFMRAEWFDFTPQFAIWMTGNHKPIIRGQDTAIWNRVKLIPFTYCVPKRDRDRDLREKILKEKEGILAWLIEGCKAWRAEGLDDPLEITGAVESYRDEMDDLGEFLRQCTEQGDSYICMASHLYDTYKRWCARNGPKPISSTAFGTQIGYRGIPKRRVAAGMLYEGLRAVKEDFLLEMAYENCAM